MKIGIIGAGNMGRSLGLLWAECGHELFFGSRDAQQAEETAALAQNARIPPRAGSNLDAALFGEVLLYSPRGVPPADVLGASDVSSLTGKIVIDIANQEVPSDFAFPSVGYSMAESLAERAPGAHVVKAFNTIPMETLELCPEAVRSYRVAAFIAGDDVNARQTVLELAEQIGFIGIVCGELRQARLLETAADLIRLLLIRHKLAGANFSVPTIPSVESPRLGGRRASKLK